MGKVLVLLLLMLLALASVAGYLVLTDKITAGEAIENETCKILALRPYCGLLSSTRTRPVVGFRFSGAWRCIFPYQLARSRVHRLRYGIRNRTGRPGPLFSCCYLNGRLRYIRC